MPDLILYTNPQSRGRIARWMLEEIGQPYETEIVPYGRMKEEAYLGVNPMDKVPALKHRRREAMQRGHQLDEQAQAPQVQTAAQPQPA